MADFPSEHPLGSGRPFGCLPWNFDEAWTQILLGIFFAFLASPWSKTPRKVKIIFCPLLPLDLVFFRNFLTAVFSKSFQASTARSPADRSFRARRRYVPLEGRFPKKKKKLQISPRVAEIILFKGTFPSKHPLGSGRLFTTEF